MNTERLFTQLDTDEQIVRVIKGLVMDGVRHANSGHTGGAFSSADFAAILFRHYLNYDPDNSSWVNRDRFVLSAGHESMLLYSLLYLTGYLKIEDLKQFRQWESRTPGHPEAGDTPGVEATSGPLGQGFSMAGGMALAENLLREMFGDTAMNHYTYVLASDGDFQEPVSYGVASLMGHLGLGRLIVYFDKNEVQLSGRTERADSTDYAAMYRALNWQVIEINGQDHEQIHTAIREAQADGEHPSLIIGKSLIARGTATMEGDYHTHGEPLPPEEIRATREKLLLPAGETFFAPSEVVAAFRSRQNELRASVNKWQAELKELKTNTDFRDRWEQAWAPAPPPLKEAPDFSGKEKLATRSALGQILQAEAGRLFNLAGGSADLDPSNKTDGFLKAAGEFSKTNRRGRHLAFGVREFPMGTILNGMALHGGLIPFGATFLAFSDYERPALRLSAIQNIPVIHIFTHDSVFLGEDGPTHQPVEQLMSLRLIPNMTVIRPADAYEVFAAWNVALANPGPTTLILSRQNLPLLDRAAFPPAGELEKGAYLLNGDPAKPADVVFLATGSEVHLALETAKHLSDLSCRVVSMPSWELFDRQPEAYRKSLLPEGALIVSLEAGSTAGWQKYTGARGLQIGLDRYGASAPMEVLMEKFGFTPAAVEEKVRRALSGK